MSLFELSAATMRAGEQRVDAAGRNVTNAETPAYKAEVAFTEASIASSNQRPDPSLPTVIVERDARQGTLFDTGGSLDFAIDGAGFLLVRDRDTYALARGGQFGLRNDGAIIDAQGRVLQLATGGDAITTNFSIEVMPDGTILDSGNPTGTIGLYDASGIDPKTTITAEQVGDLSEARSSQLRQGMLERSNVVLSDEMIDLMRAQRQLESGAQLIRAYDRLMERAISTFGGSA